MNSREQFDKAWNETDINPFLTTYGAALWGWHASRACIEIDIPDWHYQNGSSAVFVSDIKAAIESQGIKVKV